MTREALDAQRRGHAVRILLAEPSLETLQLPFIRLGRNQIRDGIMQDLETPAHPLKLPQDRRNVVREVLRELFLACRQLG